MRWICGLVVALLWSATLLAPAAAQIGPTGPRLPVEIERTTTPLSGEQIKVIEEYVRHWVGVLTSGSPENAIRGRDELVAPIDRRGTPIFLNAYSSSVSRNLLAVVTTEDPVIGLNAMIVAHRLMDAGAIDVIKTALGNQKNISVRYWASKAVEALPENLAKRDPNLKLTATDQKSLLDALVKAAEAEPSEHVMRKLLPSIVSLTIPEAGPALLVVLDARVAAHAKDAGLSVGPEADALRRLYTPVVTDVATAKANGKPINAALLSSIARVSYMYLAVSAQALRGNSPPSATAEHRAMLDIADSFLRFCVSEVNPNARDLPGTPAQFDPNWDRFSAEITRWPVILTGPPFNFDAKQLALNKGS